MCGFRYAGNDYAYVKDGHGNIGFITDHKHAIVALYRYDISGGHTVYNPDGSPNYDPGFIGNINPFRWNCFYYDAESGLYYANCRYYDPAIGRYIDAAEASAIESGALTMLGLDRNGLGCKSVTTLSPYLATIETSEKLSADPDYDPNANKPWWERNLFDFIMGAIMVVVGIVMCCFGNAGGIMMIISGVMGMVAAACGDFIAKAFGMSTTALQAIQVGISLFKCHPVLAIVSFVAAAACVAFAAAEVQEGVSGSNYIKDNVGEGWYTALMTATQLVVAALSLYNQFGPKCFAAGTLVLTAAGHKKIEDVEIGDEVWAYDEETGKSDWKPVVQLFRNGKELMLTPDGMQKASGGVDHFIKVGVTGKKGAEYISATDEHPWFILNVTEGTKTVKFDGVSENNNSVGNWVASKDLKAGNKCLLSDGETAIISSVEVEYYDELQTTYNFEVEGFHTYYVGENGVLVHNSCRGEAVRKAWKAEQQNVLDGGDGISRVWTDPQKVELINTGKVKGFVGHHMKSVRGYPHLAGDPTNIQFLTRSQHLAAHGGRWWNITHGPYLGG